ncbi:MAG TPA: hypothetical protein VKT18_05725 [Acidimicrobiales bacterium]|nr:hypothetical protein [Acidimicrobiales bacterium]
MTLDADAPSEYLVGHLEDALARDPRLCEQGLHVTMPDRNVVRVTGTLTTAERKHAIAAVIAELLPGAELRDDTTVADYPEDGRAETVGATP